MGTTEINQTTTYVANIADENYVVNVSLETTDLSIDASAPVTGRTFTVNGTLSSTNGPGIVLDSASVSLADSDTSFKIGAFGSFQSGGEGIVAYSGGVKFESTSSFSTDGTGVQFFGDNNKFKNTSADIKTDTGIMTSIGNFISTNGSALVTSGKNDMIVNTGEGTITAKLDAIVSTGDNATIINTGAALIKSRSGSAINASGVNDLIKISSQVTAHSDAIIAAGDDATIETSGDGIMKSTAGRGLVSSGDNSTVLTQAEIKASGDGIFLSGAGNQVTNDSVITSISGAAIRLAGDAGTINNRGDLIGKTFGILSIGDNATIINTKNVTATGIGIAIAGDGSTLQTTANIAARVALQISGDGTHVTNENEISGSAKHRATIEITSTGRTSITNHGAISASGSGMVIDAGNGAETIVNTSSLYGVVDLGGGNDVFKSTGEVTGAVNAGVGNDRVINTGLLQFDVNLGAGNDTFSSLKGTVGGKVIGGKGDDLYILGSDLDIREAKHGGTDTVHSKFTYTLGTNIENLQLLGKATMDATGNNLANRIEGNAGNNHLTGLGGRDVFVFETGSRQDIITDFTDHKDRIDLSGYDGVEKIADLHGKIAQSGHDVVITFAGHDQLTIENAHKSEFSGADFIF